MGVVYAGRDPRLGRRVAIKVVSERLSRNVEWSARFQREARLLASLNHPNIATIHSLERDGEVEFLTMELIEGRRLGEVIASDSLSLADALAIGRQIARGLEAAHQAGVIHRDLKPPNVMVTSELHVKLLDFGLATSAADLVAIPDSPGEPSPRLGDRRHGRIDDVDATIQLELGRSDSPSSRASSVSTGAGTPGYMSPEQIRGEDLDPRSDIWAFGCVLFELLAGTRAFDGATPLERVRSSLKLVPNLAALPASTPDSVKQLLHSCLQLDRHARLQSAREAREILEHALARRSWEASGEGAGDSGARGSAHPNNLPSALTPFVGRSRDLVRLRALLGESRLLTLTGVGGGGKTRAAIRVAEESLEEFPDGVWFVELAPVEESTHVVAAVGRTLGLSDTPGGSMAEAIVAHLASRQLLLILDNCEHVIEAVAELIRAILSVNSRAKVLITSRETLGLAGETVFQLPPLQVSVEDQGGVEALLGAEAIELFAQRAAQSLPGFAVSAANGRKVAEICERLDGIPLAIELAAARVRSLSLEEISRRLDDRFRLLRSSARATLGRHQTLEALIDWSYAHLTPNEQILLRRLSIFRGGWTLEAAEAVCSDEAIESWEVLDLLSRLIDKSLVVFGVTRYRMLETVREFGSSRRASAPDGGQLETRFREYFTGLAERAAERLVGSGQVESLARVDADVANVRAASATAVASRNAEAAIRLGQLMVRYWSIRGQFREGRQTLERALSLPGADAPTFARAMCLSGLGICLQFLCEFDGARAKYEEAIEVLRAAGFPRRAAVPQLNLGGLYRMQGDLDAAAAILAECLENLDESDHWMIASAHGNLAAVALTQSRYAEAEASYRVAVGMLRQAGDRVQATVMLANSAVVAMLTRRFEDARAIYEECLPVIEELGVRTWAPMVHSNYGIALLELGEFSGARAAFARGIRLAHELEIMDVVASSLEGFAQLAERLGDAPRSVRLLAAAEAVRSSSATPRLPQEGSEWDLYRARMNEAVGAESFARLYSEGAALGVAGGVALALAE